MSLPSSTKIFGLKITEKLVRRNKLSTKFAQNFALDGDRHLSSDEYDDKDRPAYYQAIQTARKNNMDMTTWLEYFVDGLRSQMEEIQDKGKKVVIADKAVAMLQGLGLNTRQEKIVRYLVLNEQCQKVCKSI